MCGLIGAVGPGVDSLEPEALLEKMAHRGPDSQGYATGTGWLLGHTRLAIQDLSAAANQPFKTWGGITLTYNGELWNTGQINVGERKTRSDTEVVAKALEKYGIDALARFDGMWALAWWDEADERIRLARDRWGKVPLYWATNGFTVYWASEYKGLPRGLQSHAVGPGEMVTIDPLFGETTVGPWPGSGESQMPMDSVVDAQHVRYLLRKGVQERLVGDRSIAFMLSGGLDSTLILSIARDLYQGEIVAYTAVLDPDSPDLLAARSVAKEFEVELVEVPVSAPDELLIKEAVQTVEIPMKAQVEIALAHIPVMRAVSEDGHAVCLSGEAADELFGGYGNMQIAASRTDDEGYRQLKLAAIDKMARGNFSRVNKVGMRYGVECRLPFMQSDLVELAINATKAESPPGKKLLKAAAQGLVPDRIIKRPKETFQGAVGTASAAAVYGGVRYYNELARAEYGYTPKE